MYICLVAAVYFSCTEYTTSIATKAMTPPRVTHSVALRDDVFSKPWGTHSGKGVALEGSLRNISLETDELLDVYSLPVVVKQTASKFVRGRS